MTTKPTPRAFWRLLWLALALLAAAEGVSKQEATVRAIHEAASRRLRRDQVSALSAAARDRYADLLDRLGQ